MELVETLQGKLVGVDTSLFIYFIEKNPAYLDALRYFFQENEAGKIHI